MTGISYLATPNAEQQLAVEHGVLSIGPIDEPGEGKLRGSVDGDEEMELSLFGSDLGDVDVEEADRLGLNFFLGCLSPPVSGSRLMPWR